MTKENPLSVQSKGWILTSLIELMKIKEFSTITIKEITNHANLNRKTFYRHFKSKEDVLLYYIEDRYREYLEILKNKVILMH